MIAWGACRESREGRAKARSKPRKCNTVRRLSTPKNNIGSAGGQPDVQRCCQGPGGARCYVIYIGNAGGDPQHAAEPAGQPDGVGLPTKILEALTPILPPRPAILPAAIRDPFAIMGGNPEGALASN